MISVRFLQNYMLTIVTNTVAEDGTMVMGENKNFIDLGRIIQVEDIIDIDENTVSLFFPEGICESIDKSIIEVLGLPRMTVAKPCCNH